MPETEPIRILLMEDDAGLSRLLQKRLEREGYVVDIARDGEEGLAKYDPGSHDVLLVDQKMPVYNGLDVVRILASRGPLPPAIMVTGTGDERIAVEAMKRGAVEYIIKDVDGGYLDLLPSVIEHALRRCRLEEEKQRADEALRESEDKYRMLVSHTPAVLWTSDQNGCTSFVSSNVEQVYGYTPEEILKAGNRLWFGRIHSADLASVKAAYAALLERAEPYDVEYRIQRKDGDWIWLHDRATRSYDVGGTLRVDGVFLDITERRRLEEQLRRTQKLQGIGKLAGGIAHEFNNIMMGISGYARLLLKKAEEGTQLHNDLAEICKQSDRAADLTRQLLAFSRRQALVPMVVNMNCVLTDNAKMWRRLLGDHIELKLLPATNLGNVHADRGQIEQGIVNLLLNARDAMPKGGKLTIETANVSFEGREADPLALAPGQYVKIAVADTGHGMDEATRERIFDPFFTTKDVGEGTGLGLATVYGIVQQHHGHIEVESRPGEGATFTIYFPRVEDEALPEASTAEVAASAESSETVLVVDDTEIVRGIVGRMLSEQGYSVLLASSADEAQRLFEEHEEDIALVLSDVVMPGRSGLELCKALVARKPSLKMLYMSGYSDDVRARLEASTSGEPFIQKPIAPDDLVRKVREALDA